MIAGVVLTGACAPVSEAAVERSGFSFPQAQRGDAERILGFGFDAIQERHLRKVGAADIALAGLRGLSDLDGRLAVERRSDWVVLLVGGVAIAQYRAPSERDAPEWGRLAAAAVGDLRAASPRIAAAGDDSAHSAIFDAALASLDRFSRYSGPDEARDHRSSRNGFGGIGIRYEPAGATGVEISAIMPESPAERAQLQPGDTLVAIDGASVAGLDAKEISRRLRGAIASQVVLTVLRRDHKGPLDVTVKRGLVVPQTVRMKLVDGVAEIELNGFNQRTTLNLAQKLRDARTTLGTNLKGIVLDMRGNPGGLLDQSVSVADLFMPSGDIVSTRGRHRYSNQSYEAIAGDMAEDLPLVVLVDGRSASAAEIVAAALQDSGRAVVVGTNSYGKGTVQTVIRLPNDGEMTLTWSRFHSPAGYALHELGVLPNICTSGHDARAPSVIQAALDAGALTAANIAAWRRSSVDDRDLRGSLRSTCPKQKHVGDSIELEIAHRLIDDPILYGRVRNISAPVVTAASRR